MPLEQEAAQVLEDAADILLVHGRCRLSGHDLTTGGFCVLGAIAEAVAPGWWEDMNGGAYFSVIEDHGTAVDAVAALSARVPRGELMVDLFYGDDADDGTRVYSWNDRTEDDDEVRDTLLLAAKDLRGVA